MDQYAYIHGIKTHAAWKVSMFRVFLVRIFQHLDWVRRFTFYPYSVQVRENMDQKNSEYTLGSETERKATEVRINISQKGKIVASN